MKNLTAIILAAGEGKRIQPISTPKPLLPFLGKTMIEWIISDLKNLGLKRFIVVIGPKAKDDFAAILSSEKKLDIVTQAKPTGMAKAVLAAQKKLTTPAAIIVNGNDLLAFKTYQQFVKNIKKHKRHPLVTGLKVDQPFPGGYFKLKGNQVIGIVEKPAQGYEPSPYVNLVLHYFPQVKDFITLLKKSKSPKDDHYEVALDKFLKKTQTGLLVTSEYFAALKYPWHILDVMQLCLKHYLQPGKDKSVQIHKTAVIDGPVQLESGAKIMANAVIKGPAYIGKNVIVANNALVRDSIIEEGSVIGYNTEIARSYVGPQNWFHCNFVGDSVIESNCNLGSGARLANLRFDDREVILKKDKQKLPTGKTKFGAVLAKGVKIGINASIMPGITVNAGSIIGSGVVLNHSVPANSTVYVKQQLAS